jgi:hypothetical protein
MRSFRAGEGVADFASELAVGADDEQGGDP